ncbi:MAG TPA: threonylcarbamoyl-AMP synthase [bacterium]|nr:threonylcarbamoyl-AMP synthase [bacterium]HEX67854.1 threonylcarbamoyl-AMP synthase [bacterium]
MQVEKVVEILKSGGVVALPTETVYGLISFYGIEGSWKKICELKGRDFHKPLALFIRHGDEMRKWAKFSLSAWILARNFWPGPLTLVLEIKEGIHFPWETAGFRIPDHPVPLKLLEKISPLWSTSANPSGKKSATTAREVSDYFPQGVDIIISQGEELVKGIPSTVVEVGKNGVRILREGLLKVEEVKKVLKIYKILFVCEENRERSVWAQNIFSKMLPSLKILSAGISPTARYKVNEKDMEWADLIITMEERQKSILINRFPSSHRKVFSFREIAGLGDIEDPGVSGNWEGVRKKLEKSLKILKEELEIASCNRL